MPEESQFAIGGTVIERSFVANDIATVLFAATVPLAEIVMAEEQEQTDFLKSSLSQLTGVPMRAVIDEVEYGALVRELARVVRRTGPFPINSLWMEEWEKNQRELASAMAEVSEAEDRRIRPFAEHAVALFASTSRAVDRPVYGWSFIHPPPRFIDIDLDEDAARSGIACLSARILREPKVRRFTEALLEYDLPLGQSPATTSDSLLKLLESGKKMCLAPLAAAGAQGTLLAVQGQYVAAY